MFHNHLARHPTVQAEEGTSHRQDPTLDDVLAAARSRIDVAKSKVRPFEPGPSTVVLDDYCGVTAREALLQPGIEMVVYQHSPLDMTEGVKALLHANMPVYVPTESMAVLGTVLGRGHYQQQRTHWKSLVPKLDEWDQDIQEVLRFTEDCFGRSPIFSELRLQRGPTISEVVDKLWGAEEVSYWTLCYSVVRDIVKGLCPGDLHYDGYPEMDRLDGTVLKNYTAHSTLFLPAEGATDEVFQLENRLEELLETYITKLSRVVSERPYYEFSEFQLEATALLCSYMATAWELLCDPPGLKQGYSVQSLPAGMSAAFHGALSEEEIAVGRSLPDGFDSSALHGALHLADVDTSFYRAVLVSRP